MKNTLFSILFATIGIIGIVWAILNVTFTAQTIIGLALIFGGLLILVFSILNKETIVVEEA